MSLLSLPKSIEAENTLIGLVFKDPSLVWNPAKTLKAPDFSDETNQKIWSAILILIEEGKPLDEILIQEKIRESNFKIELETLNKYTENLPLNPNIDEYIEIIKTKSISRQRAK